MIPVPGLSVMDVDRLKTRVWGVLGAGRSPIRNPGRNCAPGASFGEVGEPRVMGSVPTGDSHTDFFSIIFKSLQYTM